MEASSRCSSSGDTTRKTSGTSCLVWEPPSRTSLSHLMERCTAPHTVTTVRNCLLYYTARCVIIAGVGAVLYITPGLIVLYFDNSFIVLSICLRKKTSLLYDFTLILSSFMTVNQTCLSCGRNKAIDLG